jgi:predicted RNase H-like nuclease (RuvC/YqgF family)
VCMKIGLDVERAVGVDTALQLGGWALRAVIEKDRRKKTIRNYLMLNPPGPTRRAIIADLERDKERMHGELQDLTAKLRQTGYNAEKMTEKSSKYKKFAENWKRRSEALQAELLEANERIKFLVDKYGDVRRIHDSLQHITQETFSHPEFDYDEADESTFGTPPTSPMR